MSPTPQKKRKSVRANDPSTSVPPTKGRQPSPEKHEAIFDAAVEAFTELGFEQTSMDEIARRASVSKRTVYNHFDSKDILFEEIVRRLKDRCLSASRFSYQTGQPLEKQLFQFGRRVVDFHCHRESRRVGSVVLPRLLQKPELGKSLFGDTRFFERELTHWIQSAQEEQLLRTADAGFAARQFLGLLESFVVWPQLLRKASSPSKANRDALVQDTVAMFLKHYSMNA